MKGVKDIAVEEDRYKSSDLLVNCYFYPVDGEGRNKQVDKQDNLKCDYCYEENKQGSVLANK